MLMFCLQPASLTYGFLIYSCPAWPYHLSFWLLTDPWHLLPDMAFSNPAPLTEILFK